MNKIPPAGNLSSKDERLLPSKGVDARTLETQVCPKQRHPVHSALFLGMNIDIAFTVPALQDTDAPAHNND